MQTQIGSAIPLNDPGAGDNDEETYSPGGGVLETIQRMKEHSKNAEQEDAAREAAAQLATAEATQSNGGIPLDEPPPPPPPAQHHDTFLGSEHLGSLKDHVENFAKRLTGHGLSDSNKPASDEGVPGQNSSPAPSSPDANAAPAGTPPAGAVPSPAGAQAPAGASSPAIPTSDPVQQAATGSALKDASAQGGALQAAPPKGKAHSMTHADYHELDRLQLHAKVAAIREGKDPLAVDRAMNAQRIAFVQGGMMKALSSANAAIMAGNQPALEQAMKNANYYLPDGNDLVTHHGANGNLQYIDPFTPKTADGQPNWVDVTPEHIQLLAQNVIDPGKVGEMIQTVRANAAKIAHEQEQDKSARITADAAALTAKSRDKNADSHRALVPSQDLLNRARASSLLQDSNTKAARAAAEAKGAVTPALANTAANAASKAAEDAQQGIQETVTNEDSLQFGKPMRNNEKIAPWYKGADGKKMGPGDLNGSAAYSGKIGAANVGTMSGAEAAEVGGQIFHKQHVKMTTHKGPDGKPVADVQSFPASNQIGLWVPDDKGDGGHYRYINAYPQLLAEMQSGTDQAAAFNNIYAPAEGGDPGDDERSEGTMDSHNPTDTATAIPPPPQ